MIYVVCSREWHSLEAAFKTMKEAEEWIAGRGHKFDIIPVQYEETSK